MSEKQYTRKVEDAAHLTALKRHPFYEMAIAAGADPAIFDRLLSSWFAGQRTVEQVVVALLNHLNIPYDPTLEKNITIFINNWNNRNETH